MQDDAKTFQDKMVDILNYGSLNLAMGLGYRAGLFDVMDATGTLHAWMRSARMRTEPPLCAGVAGGDGVRGNCGTGSGRRRRTPFFCPKPMGMCLPAVPAAQPGGIYPGDSPADGLCHGRVFQGFQTVRGSPTTQYPDFHDFMGNWATPSTARCWWTSFCRRWTMGAWSRPCIGASMSATWDAPRGSPPS
jgi:hypothetical protein